MPIHLRPGDLVEVLDAVGGIGREGNEARATGHVAAVDVAERRHVRKPRGAKPGMAVYSQCRTIDVAPDLGH